MVSVCIISVHYTNASKCTAPHATVPYRTVVSFLKNIGRCAAEPRRSQVSPRQLAHGFLRYQVSQPTGGSWGTNAVRTRNYHYVHAVRCSPADSAARSVSWTSALSRGTRRWRLRRRCPRTGSLLLSRWSGLIAFFFFGGGGLTLDKISNVYWYIHLVWV